MNCYHPFSAVSSMACAPTGACASPATWRRALHSCLGALLLIFASTSVQAQTSQASSNADLPTLSVVAAQPDGIGEGDIAVFTLVASAVLSATAPFAVPVTADQSGEFLAAALPTPLPFSVAFPAGSTTAVVSLGTRDDATDEPTGSVSLSLQEDPSGSRWSLDATASSALVPVFDNDGEPRIRINILGAEGIQDIGFLYEGGRDTLVVYCIRPDRVLTEPVTVNIGVDLVGDFFPQIPRQITLPAGSNSFECPEQDIRLFIRDDNTDDDLRIPQGLKDKWGVDYVAYNGMAGITILPGEGYSPDNRPTQDRTLYLAFDNDDAPTASLASFSPARKEGDQAEFTVTLSHPTTSLVAIDYVTSDITATAGSDYTNAAGTFVINPGETVARLRLPLVNDMVAEGSETFALRLVSLATYSQGEQVTGDRAVRLVGANTATATILDLPQLTIMAAGQSDGPSGASGPASVAEGGSLEFIVSLTPAYGQPVSVEYAPADGSATQGSDYVLAAGSLTFAPNEVSKTITVAAIDDDEVESDETFLVTLANPQGAQLGFASSASAFVADNDFPDLTVPSDGQTVGESGPVFAMEGDNLEFVIGLGVPASRTLLIEYATADDTAKAGEDYVAAAGILTFVPGDLSKTITVATLDDGEVESDETVLMSFADSQGDGPDGPAMSAKTVTGDILDNDLPQLTIMAVGQQDGPGGASGPVQVTEGGSLEYVVNLNAALGWVVRVEYAAVDGTAKAGEDYVLADGTLTFAPSETSKTVTVATIDDDQVEPPETFLVSLASPYGAMLGLASSASGVVADNDLPGVTIRAVGQADGPGGASGPVTIQEGGSLEFVVGLDATYGEAVLVDYATAGGTAEAGSDYAYASGTLTFAPNEISKTITVATIDDDEIEVDETVQVSLANPEGVELGSPLARSAMATIISPDLPLLLARATSVTVDEGEVLGYMVELSEPFHLTVTVDYATGDGTAMAGEHFGAAMATLKFLPGETSKLVMVTTFDEAIGEDKSFPLTFSSVMHQTLGSAGADIRVEVIVRAGMQAAVEPVATVSAVSGSVEEGADAVFLVNVEPQLVAPVTIALQISETSAILTGAMPLSVVVPAGQTSVTFSLATVDDQVSEADSFVTLAVVDGIGYGLGSPAEAVVRVRDNDDLSLRIAAMAAQVPEGTAARFLLSASVVSADDLTVPLNVEAVGDVAAGALPASITLLAGMSSVALSIPTVDDEVHEVDATLSVALVADDGYSMGAPARATVVVQDDDMPAMRIEAVSGTVAEGEDAVFRVSAATPSTLDITVSLRVEEAADGGSFILGTPPQALTLLAGEGNALLTIRTDADNRSEPNGTIVVSLTQGEGYRLGSPASAEVQVEDNGTLEAAEQANRAILPQVGLAVAAETSRAIEGRVGAAFGKPVNGSNGSAAGGSGGGALATNLSLGGGSASLPSVAAQGGQGYQGAAASSGQAGLTLGGRTPLDFLIGQARRQESLPFLPGSDLPDRAQPGLRLRPSDVAFSYSASATGQEVGTLTLWGRGYYLNMDVSEGGVDFAGDLAGGILGLDVRLDDQALLGLAFSESQTDVGYLVGDVAGTHEVQISGFHPYLGVRLDSGVRLWAQVGLGTGELDVQEDGRPEGRYRQDIGLRSIGLGGYGPLLARVSEQGSLNLGFVTDGIFSQISEAGGQRRWVESGRVRLGVELDYSRALQGAGSWGSALELAYRRDLGEARRGGGLELGGGFDLDLPRAGLHLDLKARALLAHSRGVQEWGLAAGVKWAARHDGTGLSLSLQPSWGRVASSQGQLWDQGLADSIGYSALNPASVHYGLELQYGLPVTSRREDMLTLFARGNLVEGANSYSLGADLKLGSGFTAGYEAALGQSTGASLLPSQPGTGDNLPWHQPGLPLSTPGYLWFIHSGTAGHGSTPPLPDSVRGIEQRFYIRFRKHF